MADWPSGYAQVKLRGTYKDAFNAARVGSVIVYNDQYVVDLTGKIIVPIFRKEFVLDSNGSFLTGGILATNDPRLLPQNFKYHIIFNFVGGKEYLLEVPAETPGGILDLSTTVPIGENEESQISVLYDLAGAASMALEAANGYTDEVGEALSSRISALEAGGGGGGGGSGVTSIRHAEKMIDDDSLVALWPSPGIGVWNLAQTSAGTYFDCKIKAVSGDRIRASIRGMRTPQFFFDLAKINPAGNPVMYGWKKTNLPGPEGAPEFYPATSFPAVSAAQTFPVSLSDVDVNGEVRFALVYSGTSSSGRFYGHTTYPCWVELDNLGQQPA